MGLAARPKSVSIAAMELALRLCEQPRPEIAGHVLKTHFEELADELIAAGALVETTPSETVFMPIDLDDEPIAFEWEPDLKAYAAFHPTAGWVLADLEARRRYRLDFAWLLTAVAGAVGVASSTRPTCLLPDLLWDLGDAWLRRNRRPILFARRLGGSDEQDRVERALTAREGRADGVLLTTSPRISQAVRLPGRHRILPIRECLDQSSRYFALDVEVVGGAGPKPERSAPGSVEMGPGGSWVRIHGREYRFRGLIHRSIVQQVYEAWRDGAGRLRTQEVLEAAGSKSRELAQAFSGRPDFKEIIAYDDGFCWLKVD